MTKPEGKNLIQACLNAPDSNEMVIQCNGDDDDDYLIFCSMLQPHLSPKPNQSSTSSVIKTEHYDNGSTNALYSPQEIKVKKATKSALSGIDPFVVGSIIAFFRLSSLRAVCTSA